MIQLICLLGLLVSAASSEDDVVLSGAEFAQRALTWDLPLDQAFTAWLGTHNSYNYKPTASSVFENPHNQIRTLTEQLNLGARYIELDPHTIQLSPTDPNSITTLVCHTDAAVAAVIRQQCYGQWTRCEILGIRDYGENTGCNPTATTLQSAIAEIYAWQQKNPNELLLLYLDAELTPDTQQTIVSILGRQHIFAIADFNGTWTSPRSLIASGVSTIIMANAASDIAFKQFPNVHPAREVINFCPVKGSWGRVQADATSIRIGSTVYYNGSQQVGTILPSDVRRLQQCGLAVLIDLFNETYLSAAMWSWQSDPPLYNGERLCAGLSLTQGWKTVSCSEKHYTVCRDRISNEVMISSGSAASGSANSTCSVGSRLSTPITSSENAILTGMMKKNNISFVWLNVWSDREGCWQHADGAAPVCDRPRSMNRVDTPLPSNQAAILTTNMVMLMTLATFLSYLISIY